MGWAEFELIVCILCGMGRQMDMGNFFLKQYVKWWKGNKNCNVSASYINIV